MELTVARCESILNTLPIGYYAGRRVSITMDKEEVTSFYNPFEDTITISYPIIAERAKQMPDTANDEEAVRSMLYHEVSHAILTPTCMDATFINNVFEDQRIETVLKDYYMDVDFQKQLYDIHGGKPPKATDAESAFFNAVRFGLGTDKALAVCQATLNKYKTVNRNTPRYHSWRISSDVEVCKYENAIQQLYDLIADEFEKNPDAFSPSDASDQQMQTTDEFGGQSNSVSDNSADGTPSENASSANANDDDMMRGRPGRGKVSMSREQIKQLIEQAMDKLPNLTDTEKQCLEDFRRAVETILSDFNKRNSGGSGINAYSGVFNPRAVARQDYRYFERSMSIQGNNRFGTCHLNLIIDCSGSYMRNVPLTNGILSVLTDIEKKNRNFSMDVVFINENWRHCKKISDRRMSACGGNAIPADIKDKLRNMQKSQTCNYNIILFDGDAMCDNYDIRHPGKIKLFKAFDMNQTTLITDDDNVKYGVKNFTATKVIVTADYTENLIKHITNALRIAFK